MLTRRGRWLILLGTAGLLLGLLRGQERLAVLSLAVLLWVFGEWIWFRWRLQTTLNNLRCERCVNGAYDPTGILWTGRSVEVIVRVAADSAWTARPSVQHLSDEQSAGQHGPAGRIRPQLQLEDVLPENLELVSGKNVANLITGVEFVELQYTVRARGVGKLVLPGLVVRLDDGSGLFTARRFLAAEQSFRVFPSFIDLDEVRPTVKRVNRLPPPGIHRLQRAGMGSELLELREYVEGDPPKSIAWKVSARRDRLMTRQYESEVPVRTVLFLDTSISTRVGGFGARLLDQMTFVAASIARSAVSVRDPVGLVLFDETNFHRIDPGVGDRHFYRLLGELNRAAIQIAPPTPRPTPSLFDAAWQVCHERFPERLEPGINQVPFTWLPDLPHRRRRADRRMRMASLFAELYGLTPDSTIELVQNEAVFADYAQRFLIDSGSAWMEPAIDRRGRGFHDCMAKLEPLGQALTQAVAHGRDNELFVLLVDLIDCANEANRLSSVIRLALARHHRVVVICPTPDFRRPAQRRPPRPRSGEHATSVEERAEPFVDTSLDGLLIRAEQLRLDSAAEKLRRELRRLGAGVAFSADRSAVKLVLAEADLARHGRLHRRG